MTRNVVPLSIHTAHVKTADVQIKALTVSGKQVTLAVFRQLLREPLITHEGTLAGIPWGLVNYHPDKCESWSLHHYHVVWQLGDQLRRSNVIAQPSFFDDEGPVLKAAYPWLRALIRDWMRGGEPVDFSGSHYVGFRHTIEVAGIRLHIGLDEVEAQVVSLLMSSHKIYEYAETEKLVRFHHETDQSPSAGVERQKLIAAAMKEAARRQKVLDATAAIAALPQLFIAL